MRNQVLRCIIDTGHGLGWSKRHGTILYSAPLSSIPMCRGARERQAGVCLPRGTLGPSSLADLPQDFIEGCRFNPRNYT